MALDRILVCTDFSENALAAATWVSRHLAPGATVTLAHALHVPEPPDFLRRLAREPATVLDEAEASALTKMKAFAESFPPERTRTVVRRGAPYEELPRLALEEHADLLVVGAHGLRSRKSRLLGTTADRLVQHSPLPVLVYSGVPRSTPRRVLAGVDDSVEAGAVMRLACELCDPAEGEVRLLHVLSTAAYSHALSMSAIGARDDEEAMERMRDELRAVSEHWLNEMSRTIRTPPRRVQAEVVHGYVSEAILGYARQWKADIIVLGRHGSGTGARAMLGGSVRRVLHESEQSVAVVPAPPTRA